jgi:F0F1-type ATP synthase membrane subunit b/b'
LSDDYESGANVSNDDNAGVMVFVIIALILYCFHLNGNIHKLQATLNYTQAQLEDAESQRDDLQSQLDESNEKLENINSEVSGAINGTYEEQEDALNNVESESEL